MGGQTGVTSGYLSRDQTLDSYPKRVDVVSEKKHSVSQSQQQSQHNNSAIVRHSKQVLPRPQGVLSERDDLVVVQNEIYEYSSLPMNQMENSSELINNSFHVSVNDKRDLLNQDASVARAKQIVRQQARQV